MTEVSRRGVIAGVAAGAAVLVGWSRFGSAFQLVPMDAQGVDAIAKACGGPRDDHRRMIEAVMKDNDDRPIAERLSQDRLLDVLSRASCPVCGCAIGPFDASLVATD